MAYLKSVFFEKNALREDETVVLTKECSALVQKKLPLKMLDPGNFLTPCTKGTITFEKALCDLGSSINLIPLSVIKKLGIQEAQPTKISLEMADKSLKRAYELVENVLVKVEDFYLPTDFVILDTGKEKDDSIILRRPFLPTGRALIDVERGELVLRMHEDYMLFKIFKPLPLSKGGTSVQSLELQPSHLVKSHTVPPDIKPKFGVGHSPPTVDGGGPKNKVPKGWRNKNIPTEDFSPGMRVVFTQSPVKPHTVNRILSLEHVELIHKSTEKKFTMRGEDLSPYGPPP
ncbi:Retrotransposon gag protein [Arachis hypogaea]|nr:Retrotransposon gag protein [Arachis hypogaea]